MQAVCLQIGGATSSPTPAFFFLSCTRPRQVSSCQQKQNPYGPFSEPVNGGGGLRPFFFARTLHHQQDLLRANCYRPVQIPSCRQSICKRGGCLDLFKNHHARSLFANGAAASPEAIWTLSEPVTCVCKWRGLRPPPTPLFLFTPCRLAFKNIAPSARLASRAQLL